MPWGRLIAVAYVAAPAVLLAASEISNSERLFLAALVVSLPLSLTANVAAYITAGLLLPTPESNGLPILAAFLTAGAWVQAWGLCAALRYCRMRPARAH